MYISRFSARARSFDGLFGVSFSFVLCAKTCFWLHAFRTRYTCIAVLFSSALITLKDGGIFVSCFLSHALEIFGAMAVCARAFAERGFCRTVHLSTPRFDVLNEMQFYESYDSYELTRSLN